MSETKSSLLYLFLIFEVYRGFLIDLGICCPQKKKKKKKRSLRFFKFYFNIFCVCVCYLVLRESGHMLVSPSLSLSLSSSLSFFHICQYPSPFVCPLTYIFRIISVATYAGAIHYTLLICIFICLSIYLSIYFYISICLSIYLNGKQKHHTW